MTGGDGLRWLLSPLKHADIAAPPDVAAATLRLNCSRMCRRGTMLCPFRRTTAKHVAALRYLHIAAARRLSYYSLVARETFALGMGELQRQAANADEVRDHLRRVEFFA
jgi:hypothetical protein